MDVHGGDTPIRLVWERQSVWSQAALAQKASIEGGRRLALFLGIAAAALGTSASQLMDVSSAAGRVTAFAAALAGGAVPLAARRSSPQATQDWTRLRSVAEALKSAAYTWLAGAGPYRGVDAERELRDRLARLESDAVDLAHHVTDRRPVQRELPPVRDLDTYRVHRLQQQIARYYRPQASRMRQQARRVRQAETVLALVGAALGGVAGAFGVQGAGYWIAVVGVAATAVTAHAAAARYAYQELEYARTAGELEVLRLRGAAVDPGDAGAADLFVEECERIISVQNDAWMVKWTTG